MSAWRRRAIELVICLVPVAALGYLAFWRAGAAPALVLFFLRLLAVATPLGVLARFHHIYPAGRLALVALVPAAASLLLVVQGEWTPLLWAIDLGVLGLAAFDLFSLPRPDRLQAERTVGRIASLRKPHRVALSVTNQTGLPLQIEVRDGVPWALDPDPAEFAHRLEARRRVTFRYQLRPSRRGAFRLEQVFLRAASRWSWWRRLVTLPLVSEIHVYPDMQQLSQYALLARQDRLNLLGMRRARRVGQDNEFERLRDYTPDDSYKNIEWRSTARRQKLTVKDFQQNQSQRLVFLIDCGRMMTNQAAGLSLLDHSLNAMLMLSYVALTRGDAVGLMLFSDQVHDFVGPRTGMRQMNRLLHASFDRFPRLAESRYDRAFLHLATQVRKRSLVVLVTNVIDDVNRNQIEQYLKNVAGRHLPLGVLLRDRSIFDYAEQPDPQGRDLYRAAAAADILLWRQQVLSDLHAQGVLVVDAYPDVLTAPLVNRYLEIKARHLL